MIFARMVVIALVLGAVVAAVSAHAAQQGELQLLSGGASPLGMNLGEVVDYGDEDPFLDFMKQSRPWVGQTDTTFDTGESDRIDLDADGWVRSLAPLAPAQFTRVATILMTAGDPHNDYAGNYVVLYEGEGTIEYGGGAQLICCTPGTGRDLIAVEPSGTVILAITATDPQGTGNYLRNIRVVREQYEDELAAGQIFDPTWLAKLAPFGTLRFMDWMRTNGSTQSTFAGRAPVSAAQYTTERGVPLEIMIALANQTRSAAWFNMPAEANDDFIRRFAVLVRDTLAPDLPVYIEYSNEVWNTGWSFHPQDGYIDQQADAEFGSAGDSFYTRRMNWHGMRTGQMCAIWKDVFGTDASRVICTLGAQAANTFTAAEALDCPLWVNDPDNPDPAVPKRTCREYGIDAVAIAPYFGSYIGDPGWEDQVQRFTLNQIFTEIFSGGLIADPAPGDWNDPPPGGALAESYGWMDAYDELGAAYGLPIVGYEGGQHLAGIGAVQDNAAVNALFDAANRDERMGQAYAQYLAYWKSGSLSHPNTAREAFAHYSFAGRYSQYGRWGALEYIEQNSSPKYDALSAFAAANACWWPDCAIAGPVETPTNTPTNTPANTPANTPTNTPTNTPAATPANTPTATPANTPAATPANTPAATPANTPAATPAATPANTPTNTPTNTPAATPAATPASTKTMEPSPTATHTPQATTPTPVIVPPSTPTAVPSGTPLPPTQQYSSFLPQVVR